ncbi:MAG TPA: hypothetical protein VMD04_02805 [Candidatus Margulisiibacteriota bacterium]|nr:hypothetical protein [Candidatus Margulisiibacteriota bacterium]
MRSVGVFLVLFVFLAMVSSAYAHPPSDIIITFNQQTKMLEAVIMHNVSNPENHYIKKVDVGRNGKEIISQEFSRQENNEIQTVHYLITDAKAGDVFSVEGYCSISGKLKKEIKVQ